VTMRRAAIVAAGVAVVLAGLAVLRPNREQADNPPTSTSVAPGPDSRSDAAAERPDPSVAAARAVRATGEIATAGFITRDDLLDSIASPAFAPTLRSASAAHLTELVAAVGAVGVPASGVVWEELPLTLRVVSEDTGKAQVSVWSVLIVGVPGHGSPRQFWRTSTIDLVLVADTWLVDGWTATPGPTPALGVDSPISDVAAIDTVLAWDHMNERGR
jgi:hypothetical protein